MERRNIKALGILLLCLLLAETSQAQLGRSRHHDIDYLDRSREIKKGDIASRLALAARCREQKLFREMLREIDLILEERPDDVDARALLWQSRSKDGWTCSFPTPATISLPEPDCSQAARDRTRLLNEGRSRKFQMGKKAFRFEYWTDIDKERCSRYARLMNQYYDRLKGFFQVTKTEVGIIVLIFAKRSDYLDFYCSYAGRSGEHTTGFFSYSRSLVCFYDDPYDSSVFNTAKHECTHLLLMHCLKGAQTAPWLNEGLAVYFAADGPEFAGSYAASCLFTVLEDIRKNRVLTLEKMMNTPYEKYGFREYATAWSWICFLHNDPEMKGKLGKLFRRLRQEASKIDENDEESESHLDQITNKLFREIFGAPGELQAKWTAFVEKELLPSTPQRCLDLARCCLRNAASRKSKERASDKRLLLDRGEKWLRRANDLARGDLEALCRLEQARALLARASCLNYDAREAAYTAGEVVRIIDDLLEDPANVHLASDAGLIAHSALLSIWQTGDFEEEDDMVACDFNVLLQQAESASAKGSDPALIRLQKEIVIALASLARYAYALTLSHDPAHEPAVNSWLHLALDFAPAELDAVFPHVLFLVQEDPADTRLAALAAAYAGLGKYDHARTLLERACFISVDENAVKEFGLYVDRAPAKR